MCLKKLDTCCALQYGGNPWEYKCFIKNTQNTSWYIKLGHLPNWFTTAISGP